MKTLTFLSITLLSLWIPGHHDCEAYTECQNCSDIEEVTHKDCQTKSPLAVDKSNKTEAYCPYDQGCYILSSLLNNGELLGTKKGCNSALFECVYNTRKDGDRCLRAHPEKFKETLDGCKTSGGEDGEDVDSKKLSMTMVKPLFRKRHISEEERVVELCICKSIESQCNAVDTGYSFGATHANGRTTQGASSLKPEVGIKIVLLMIIAIATVPFT